MPRPTRCTLPTQANTTWPGTTQQGIVAAVTAGMLSSMAWILLSADTFENVYGLSRDLSPMPFSSPGS